MRAETLTECLTHIKSSIIVIIIVVVTIGMPLPALTHMRLEEFLKTDLLQLNHSPAHLALGFDLQGWMWLERNGNSVDWLHVKFLTVDLKWAPNAAQ